MGLLPLEFTECLQDSPYFRDSLHSHEKELERTSQNIKELIKEVKSLMNAAKVLSAAQRRLSQHLVTFKFECIGNQQTDDELIIAGSLKQFGKLIAAIEDEKDRMLERAVEQFIIPLESFRKDQIGAVKERKKKFEKQTAKFYASQERYLGLSTKKTDNLLLEADASLEMEQRDFVRAGLEYVCLIQEVQERKKFEFVETLLGFMYGWLTFYHQGHEVANDFKPHMTELQTRIQKSRESFNASREDIQALMRKMLEVRQTKPIDAGSLNRMYTRSGYLFVMEKKALSTAWTKCYCKYRRHDRVFCMIPYSQTSAKIVSNETFQLKACVKRLADTIDKRFLFDVSAEDRQGTTYTLQALSEEDRSLWLEAMGGTDPIFPLPPIASSNAEQTSLDEAGFFFIAKCIQALETRGLEEQGLYRVAGVSSKVTKLLTMGLDRRKCEKLNLGDTLEWESKTITSAIKKFFNNLPEPIMTFHLHSKFIEAAKLETYEKRVAEVKRLIDLLPTAEKRMLEVLCRHLERVSLRNEFNKMTVSNLGVCFGPTLLRSEEESVAAIMDIKFGNIIVELLIENWRNILLNDWINDVKNPLADMSQLTVLPFESQRIPTNLTLGLPSTTKQPIHMLPPYFHPPEPPLALLKSGPNHPVFSDDVNNHKKSIPSHTWERTLRCNDSLNIVQPPLASAPTVSTVPVHSVAPWYRPNQVVVRAVQLQQKQSIPTSGRGKKASADNSSSNTMVMASSSSSINHQSDDSAASSHATSCNNSQNSSLRTANFARSSSSSSSLDSLASESSKQMAVQRLTDKMKIINMEIGGSSGHEQRRRSSNSSLTVDKRRENTSTSSLPTLTKNARTLYACVGEHSTELSFEPNQLLTNVRPSLEPGWLEGCLNGRVGLVPENYVEFLRE